MRERPVVTYQWAYVGGDTTLCDRHAEERGGELGPVQRGRREGHCDDCCASAEDAQTARAEEPSVSVFPGLTAPLGNAGAVVQFELTIEGHTLRGACNVATHSEVGRVSWLDNPTCQRLHRLLDTGGLSQTGYCAAHYAVCNAARAEAERFTR